MKLLMVRCPFCGCGFACTEDEFTGNEHGGVVEKSTNYRYTKVFVQCPICEHSVTQGFKFDVEHLDLPRKRGLFRKKGFTFMSLDSRDLFLILKKKKSLGK